VSTYFDAFYQIIFLPSLQPNILMSLPDKDLDDLLPDGLKKK